MIFTGHSDSSKRPPPVKITKERKSQNMFKRGFSNESAQAPGNVRKCLAATAIATGARCLMGLQKTEHSDTYPHLMPLFASSGF